MGENPTERTQRRYARLAGFLLLWLIATGIAAMVLTSHIAGSGTFAETAKRIAASEHLYRRAPQRACRNAECRSAGLRLVCNPQARPSAPRSVCHGLETGRSIHRLHGGGLWFRRAPSLPLDHNRARSSPSSGRSHRPGGFTRHQHQRDVLQYWLSVLLLPVFKVKIPPQGAVRIRHICLGRCYDYVSRRSPASRIRSDAAIRLGPDGPRRSRHRLLADAVFREDRGPQRSPIHPNGRRRRLSAPAFLALAMPPQIIPGINTARVPVIPLEADRIIAHRAGRLRPRRRHVHRQQPSCRRLGLARRASRRLSLLMAGRAWTSIPQPDKPPSAAMPILPVDFEALAARLQNPNLRWCHRIARQFRRDRTPSLFLADDANPFVTHRPTIAAASLQLTARR